jgi:hypothetical protein
MSNKNAVDVSQLIEGQKMGVYLADCHFLRARAAPT